MRSKNNNLKQCLSSIVIAISILCSFGFLFLGCATAPGPKAEPPLSPPPLPKAKNSAPPATAEIKITCREYLLKGKNEETGYGLYSYYYFLENLLAKRNSKGILGYIKPTAVNSKNIQNIENTMKYLRKM